MKSQNPALEGPFGNEDASASPPVVTPVPRPHFSSWPEALQSDIYVGLRQEEKSQLRIPNLTDADAEAIRRVLGFDGDRCPLPGHDGDAADIVAHKGTLRFDCDCHGRSAVWDVNHEWRSRYDRSLADAYWLVKTGQVAERRFRLSAGLRFLSRLLLTHEVGLIEPAAVICRDVPREASDLARQAREFFRLVYGLRLAVDATKTEAEGIAFTDRLLSAWFRVPRDDARAAINALRDAGVIVQVGRAGSRGPFLWQPGLHDAAVVGRGQSNWQA